MGKSRGVVLGEGHVNRVGPAGAFIGNREGFGSKSGPPKFNGTVNKQFEGDQKGNQQEGVASGTPAAHNYGNADETSRQRPTVVLSAGGVNLNDPAANGNGVVFDGVSQANGRVPTGRATLDSPVPEKAPYFETRSIAQETRARLGQNNPVTQDNLVTAGGVMSRGMQGTSSSKGGENELREDDTLKNMGRGGAVG